MSFVVGNAGGVAAKCAAGPFSAPRGSRDCSEIQVMRRYLKNYALQLQYYSALYRLIPRSYSGIGTIFIMHKVVNDKSETLATQLTITRDFLNRFISRFKQSVDFISLDEIYRRLTRATRRKAERPFIALTF